MTKGSNQPKISLFLSFISIKNDIWGMKMDTNLFWGVRGKVKFLFGGMQEGLILIWGYASIKRLRTLDLHSFKTSKKY